MIRLLKFVLGWPLSILALIFIGKIIFSHGATVYANLHMLFEAEFLVFGSMIIALQSGSFIFYQLLPGFPYKNIVLYGVIILVLLVVFVFLLSSSFPKPFRYMFPPFGFSQNLSLFFIALLYFSFFGIGTYFTILAVQFLDPKYVLEL